MSNYFATFPLGIEDVVRNEFLRFIATFMQRHKADGTIAVMVLSRDVPKERLVGNKRDRKQAKRERAKSTSHAFPSSVAAPSLPDKLSPRGALYFSIARTDSSLAAEEMEFQFLYEAGFSLRTIDQVCLSLDIFTMTGSATEMNTPIAARKTEIYHAVITKLSAYRQWLRKNVDDPTYAHRFPGFLFGQSFLSPLTDATVLFRVNTLRRDKLFPENAPAIASQVGDQLVEHFYEGGWRVSMVYHNVEFFLLHDHARFAHLGLVFSAPALPRGGMEFNVARQFFIEFLRQRIGRMLLSGEVTDGNAVKGLITRPSTMRYEMRMSKGENAMLVPLAASLVCYADLDSRREQLALLLDPFGGCGSLLTEAWIAGGCKPMAGLCGEMSEADYSRALKNLSPAATTMLAVINGFCPAPAGPPTFAEALNAWRRSLEKLADSIVFTGEKEANAVAIEAVCACSELEEKSQELEKMLGTDLAPTLFTPHFAVVQADATKLPLPSCSVECVISDMPFGRRCGNHRANLHLYPLFLQECHRVLTDDGGPTECNGERAGGTMAWWRRASQTDVKLGGRAVLLTLDASFMMETIEGLQERAPFRLLQPPFMVEMAGLFPYVFVLDKVVQQN